MTVFRGISLLCDDYFRQFGEVLTVATSAPCAFHDEFATLDSLLREFSEVTWITFIFSSTHLFASI